MQLCYRNPLITVIQRYYRNPSIQLLPTTPSWPPAQQKNINYTRNTLPMESDEHRTRDSKSLIKGKKEPATVSIDGKSCQDHHKSSCAAGNLL